MAAELWQRSSEDEGSLLFGRRGTRTRCRMGREHGLLLAQLNSTILGAHRPMHRPVNGDTESPVVAGASGVCAALARAVCMHVHPWYAPERSLA